MIVLFSYVLIQLDLWYLAVFLLIFDNSMIFFICQRLIFVKSTFLPALGFLHDSDRFCLTFCICTAILSSQMTFRSRRVFLPLWRHQRQGNVCPKYMRSMPCKGWLLYIFWGAAAGRRTSAKPLLEKSKTHNSVATTRLKKKNSWNININHSFSKILSSKWAQVKKLWVQQKTAELSLRNVLEHLNDFKDWNQAVCSWNNDQESFNKKIREEFQRQSIILVSNCQNNWVKITVPLVIYKKTKPN